MSKKQQSKGRMETIAEKKFLLVSANGTRKEVTAKIGRPIPSGRDTYLCPAQLEGIFENIKPLEADDGYQALVLAIAFLRSLVEDIAKKKDASVTELDGTHLDLDISFGPRLHG